MAIESDGMNQTDFQQYAMQKLDKIAEDVATLKGEAKSQGLFWGAIAAALSMLYTTFINHMSRNP